jgi:NADH-quinone oxidoreductase subunit D/NADH-quinone oxidoreductase subunit C/D
MIENVTSPEAPPPAAANPAENATATLRQRYDGVITSDSRPGHTGLIVPADRLVEVAMLVRDELGFNYLSSATAVDLIDDNKMEMVYHCYSTEQGGGALVLKCQVDRDEPKIPTLVPVWPGAEFQEREAYDLYGIEFPGHPDLRRILLWDGFAGHPMRKDWREPFYEDEHKPFGSRWPDGHVFRAEEKNPYGMNVQYPPGFMPDQVAFEADNELYTSMSVTPDPNPTLKTERVTVNLGPQHPSTHGVFRMVVTLDGETVVELKPVMGYLHRNHEQIGERNLFLQNMPYTDRLDYLSSMGNNHGYALAIEKLMGIGVPERAEWIRILMVELTRIANHAWALGFLLNDLARCKRR